MMTNRLLRISLLLVVGLAIASLIAYYQIRTEQGSASINKNVVAANFGGPFTLINEDGEQVTQDDFKGQYRLIYFGFTFCPAICPTELQKITAALNELGPAGEKIKPIFITVDPERDTVETMKQYIGSFHPNFTGLSGSMAQIDQAKKSYKIYAAKVQDETMSDYTMDHSSYIYFLDPDDNLVRIFKIDDTAQDMVQVIKPSL